MLAGHKGPVRGLGLTPDGQTIVTGGDDGTVRFWKAHDGKPQGGPLVAGHAGAILAVAISPDGKLILTGSADKTARLIARSDGKLIRTLARHKGPVRSVAFSPNGDRVATADARGGLKVWETATGCGVIAFGHTAPGGAAIQPIKKVRSARAGVLWFRRRRMARSRPGVSRGRGRCTRRWAPMSSGCWRSTSARTAVCSRPAGASRRDRAR